MDCPIKKSLYHNVLPFSKPIYGRNFLSIDQFLLYENSLFEIYIIGRFFKILQLKMLLLSEYKWN